MDDSSVEIVTHQETAGDRIRKIADQLKQETSLQIKATSRILAAAAQISENHDRLIEEVVEMIEDDLEQQTNSAEIITVEQLKQRFKKLEQAKAHFRVKASSWALLADKLNQKASPKTSEIPVSQRLESIETELKALRTDINQSLDLLALILQKIS